MTIKKYTGQTEDEAKEKAKTELGDTVVIMSSREIRPTGIFRFFKRSSFEVTAAIEVKEREVEYVPVTAVHEVKKEEKAEQRTEQKTEQKSEGIEEKLESLHHILERQFSKEVSEGSGHTDTKDGDSEPRPFLKILYEMLMDNEVDEQYVNQIIDEMDQGNWKMNNVDQFLSNVYQKMVLKFGSANPIGLTQEIPKVVFFIGPTGVGKTTTIAKIASEFKIKKHKKVAFLTADTYRIAAAEQLRTYANILDAPMSIVYAPEELNAHVEELKDYDLILVDTAGFSHKNQEQKEDVKELIHQLDPSYESSIYLVLSATTKYRDLKDIIDIYKEISDFHLIFTKLDETSYYGNILNIRLYSQASLSYITTGQNVPNDIEVMDSQKIVKRLLGGR